MKRVGRASACSPWSFARSEAEIRRRSGERENKEEGRGGTTVRKKESR